MRLDARSCSMVQELGTLPIRLFGSDELKERFLPRCATGEWTPGLRAVRARGRLRPRRHDARAPSRDGDEWVVNGTKNWITNLGIADFYVVFAVTDPTPATRAASARSSSRPTGRASASASSSTSSASAARRPASRSSTTCASRPRTSSARRGQGLERRAGDARPLAARRRRAGARHRAGRDRLRRRLRAGAPAVRPADRRFQGDPVQARRHGDAAPPPARELLYQACAKADRGERDMASSRRWRSSSPPTPRWR